MRLRYFVPFIAGLLALLYAIFEHSEPAGLPEPVYLIAEVFIIVVVWPVTTWLTLTWIAQHLRTVDVAEAQLRALHEISHEAITTGDMEGLVDIITGMCERVLGPVATSLIMRDHPDDAWVLAGTHRVDIEQQATLEALLQRAGPNLECPQCGILAAAIDPNCPALAAWRIGLRPPTASQICLALSAEHPPSALLYVYLTDRQRILPDELWVLELSAATLAVVLDNARLRARTLQMFREVEQAVPYQKNLGDILQRTLADIATAHWARSGAIFIKSQNSADPRLSLVASWPEKEIDPGLLLPASQAVSEGRLVVAAEPGQEGRVTAVPLVAEGMSLGAIVLTGQHPFHALQIGFLTVAAGAVALIIRNSQLYSSLESQVVLEERNRLAREVHDGLAQGLGFLSLKAYEADGLLDQERWVAARRVLLEMREEIHNLNAEARQTVVGLYWRGKKGDKLAERLREYARDFSARKGLHVSVTMDMDDEPPLTSQQDLQIFRIVQEALANAHRHARAHHVSVRVEAGPREVTLEVTDDGVGLQQPSPNPAVHVGMRVMRERAEAMGGRLSLDAVPGRGTTVRVTVPLENSQSPFEAKSSV